jgi:glycosyltransferase involved in cell wall biosynthesis
MKIVFISAFSPSRLGLNEYALKLIEQAHHHPDVEILILADRNKKGMPESELPKNVKIERIWSYNNPMNPIILVYRIVKEDPDIIWYNLILSTFGDKKIPAFLGFITPLCLKILGYKQYATLHHLVEFMDLSETRFVGQRKIIILFAKICQMILTRSTHLCLLLNKYVDCIQTSYSGLNPFRTHHGFPTVSIKSRNLINTRFSILVFGKFGSYKKLNFAIECIRKLRIKHPGINMIVAGSSHPSYPGYYEDFSKKYVNEPGVSFLGYVLEEKLSEVFLSADLVFLPYSSATGISGVAHHAASFGLPVVAPNIPDFIDMELEESIIQLRFTAGSVEHATSCIEQLYENKEMWQKLSDQNLNAAKVRNFRQVFESYLNIFRGFNQLNYSEPKNE